MWWPFSCPPPPLTTTRLPVFTVPALALSTVSGAPGAGPPALSPVTWADRRQHVTSLVTVIMVGDPVAQSHGPPGTVRKLHVPETVCGVSGVTGHVQEQDRHQQSD